MSQSQARPFPKGLWLWAVAAAIAAIAVGYVLFDQQQLLSIGIGCLTGLVILFMLQRMASKAIIQGNTGKGLILGIFFKSFIRFLLTGLILAILFYLGWLKPFGFMIGFTAIIGAIFVWGCSRLLLKK